MIQTNADEVGDYLHRAESGETLILLRAGQSIAEIKPVAAPPQTLRSFGLCAGESAVPDDFDAPLPDEILDAFGSQRE